MGKFTPLTVMARWLGALFTVFASYNPSGTSYYHWATRGHASPAQLVLAGVALLILVMIYLRATLRSLGPIGMGLAYALFGSVAWLLAYWRIVDLAAGDQRVVVAEAISASVLGIGLSWSGIRYKISGQYDSEDVGAGPLA